MPMLLDLTYFSVSDVTVVLDDGFLLNLTCSRVGDVIIVLDDDHALEPHLFKCW